MEDAFRVGLRDLVRVAADERAAVTDGHKAEAGAVMDGSESDVVYVDLLLDEGGQQLSVTCLVHSESCCEDNCRPALRGSVLELQD